MCCFRRRDNGSAAKRPPPLYTIFEIVSLNQRILWREGLREHRGSGKHGWGHKANQIGQYNKQRKLFAPIPFRSTLLHRFISFLG